MDCTVTGVSHKTAPLELRERLAFGEEAAVCTAQSLLATHSAREAVVLSTCNRTELYTFTSTPQAAHEAALAEFARHAGVAGESLAPSVYTHTGDAAIEHLFRVAASLDSLVLGEDQILSQVKAAYRHAHAAGCTSAVLNRLFRRAIEVGKRVRTETAIAQRPVSVSSAAVELAQRLYGALGTATVLVVGAGETGALVAVHFASRGAGRVLVANRTAAAAERLARRVNGTAVPFEQLEQHLAAADIVVSSTAAPCYVLTPELVARAAARRTSPLYLFDIAVPRDVDPAVHGIEGVSLHHIDHLERVVQHNRGERELAAQGAERIIAEELERISQWFSSLEVVPTITDLRELVEGIRRAELERLGGRLGELSCEQRAEVEFLTTSIVNKILHAPTVKMKELAGREECSLYTAATRTLFGLEESS